MMSYNPRTPTAVLAQQPPSANGRHASLPGRPVPARTQTGGSIRWNPDPVLNNPSTPNGVRPDLERQPTKSCLRTPQDFSIVREAPRRRSEPNAGAEYVSPAPRQNEARHDSPNAHVGSTTSFALNRTKSMDPSRGPIRAPTPFRSLSHDSEYFAGAMVDELSYATPEEVAAQLEEFLIHLTEEIGKEAMRSYINPAELYAFHLGHDQPYNGHIFDVPLGQACRTAPCLAFFAEHQHRIPVLVFSVVEEIYARGMHTPGLFRLPGDLKRVDGLVHVFDVAPYGEDYPVDQETIPDLCGLLMEFLGRLPEPLFDSTLEKALFSLVVCGKGGGRTPEKRVHVAQILMRLLPAPNLSLLVYILSFLRHLQKEASTSLNDLADIFGPYLAMCNIPGTSEAALRAQKRAEHDAREVVKWLLYNWEYIMNGLFDEPILEIDHVSTLAHSQNSSKRDTPSVAPLHIKKGAEPTRHPSENGPRDSCHETGHTPSSSSAFTVDPALFSIQERIITSQQSQLACLSTALDKAAERVHSLVEHTQSGPTINLATALEEITKSIGNAQRLNKQATDEAERALHAVAKESTSGTGLSAEASLGKELEDKVARVEAENEKLAKKLKAAQDALNAALAA